MEISTSEHTFRIIVVYTQGRLDAFNAPELRKSLADYQDEGNNRFVIDLSRIVFLDSAGLAVLLSLLKRARQSRGDVKLVWPQEEGPQQVLRKTGFDHLFDIAENDTAALKRFWK